MALPELPLLAVLPGTGGLTRVTDKRKVRRDLADAFCTIEEGVKGKRAVEWRLVDQMVPNSKFDQAVTARAKTSPQVRLGRRCQGHRADAARAQRSAPTPSSYSALSRSRSIARDAAPRPSRSRARRARRPPPPTTCMAQGAEFWPLRLARELDDAILHLRLNEPEIGVLIFKSQGEPRAGAGLRRVPRRQQGALAGARDPHYWKRVLKRVD